MKNNIKLLLIGLLSIALLSGCGGGGGGGSDDAAVSISPSSATLSPLGQQQFTATVDGVSGVAVTWSVEPQTSGGSITATGLYTAPVAAGTYYVVATSQADSTKSGKAKVNVVVGGGGGGPYYTGQITIERSGIASNNMNYNEGATITNFKLIEGAGGAWGLTGTSTVNAHVANVSEAGAHIDYGPATKASASITILLSIHDSTYDLMVVPYAEGATVTPASGPVTSMDWPIAVSPIQNQPLPANPNRITGSIVDTQLANCTVTWDLIKN